MFVETAFISKMAVHLVYYVNTWYVICYFLCRVLGLMCMWQYSGKFSRSKTLRNDDYKVFASLIFKDRRVRARNVNDHTPPSWPCLVLVQIGWSARSGVRVENVERNGRSERVHLRGDGTWLPHLPRDMNRCCSPNESSGRTPWS